MRQKVKKKVYDISTRIVLLTPRQSKWQRKWLKIKARFLSRPVIDSSAAPLEICRYLEDRYFNALPDLLGCMFWLDDFPALRMNSKVKALRLRSSLYDYGLKVLTRTQKGVEASIRLLKLSPDVAQIAIYQYQEVQK